MHSYYCTCPLNLFLFDKKYRLWLHIFATVLLDIPVVGVISTKNTQKREKKKTKTSISLNKSVWQTHLAPVVSSNSILHTPTFNLSCLQTLIVP